MKWFKDLFGKKIRFTDERKAHIENTHPEMNGQIGKIENALLDPDCVVKSKIDPKVDLYHKYYTTTPVSNKYLCVVVKVLPDNVFIITTFFTDTIKRGEIIWKKKK